MFERHIINLLKKEIKQDVILETPPSGEFGDYAFPCFQLAKIYRKSPVQIAEELAKKFEPDDYIAKVKPVGPYINFFVNRQKFIEVTLKQLLKEGPQYGSSNEGRKKRIVVEHTSINPNAAPHVGRARGAIIGDFIASIMRFHGYKVDVHYFVNDIGKQIAMLVYACGKKKVSFDRLLDKYVEINKKLKENPGIEAEILGLLNRLEKGDKSVLRQFRRIVNICVNGQKSILASLGIHYNFFDYESDFIKNKSVEKILGMLHTKKEFFKDEHGRMVLDQSELANEMRAPYLVLARSDSTSLYPLRDLAYTVHKLKLSPMNYVLLGEDQKLYFKQISSALSLLGFASPKAIHYSHILLKEGRMSTREGNLVLLTELMDKAFKKASVEIKKRKYVTFSKSLALQIGYGAVKYSILKISPEKNVIFDWDTALSFEGEASPYIQYSYARASSILRKAKLKPSKADFRLLSHEAEYLLVKKLGDFPETSKKALSDLKPNNIAKYAYELSQLFNEFYHSCQCISGDRKLTSARLSLVRASRTVIKSCLGLLGIAAPEKM